MSLALAVTTARLLHGRFPPPFDNGTRTALFIGAVIILVSGLATIWGVRSAFARRKLSEELSRSMHDATHALGAMRGKRRPDEVDDDEPDT